MRRGSTLRTFSDRRGFAVRSGLRMTYPDYPESIASPACGRLRSKNLGIEDRVELGNGNQYSTAAEISRGMVAIYKDVLGRGPTRARTTIANDMVVTVLEDSLTKGERTLAAQDRVEAVRELRRTLQEAMSSEITKLVETTLHREVLCFLSDHSPNPDYAIEVLLLAPRSDGQEPVVEDLDATSDL